MISGMTSAWRLGGESNMDLIVSRVMVCMRQYRKMERFTKCRFIATGICQAYIVNNFTRSCMRQCFGFIVFPSSLLLEHMMHPAGVATHIILSIKAVYHLPNQMFLFIQDSSFFALHASDADDGKRMIPQVCMEKNGGTFLTWIVIRIFTTFLKVLTPSSPCMVLCG